MMPAVGGGRDSMFTLGRRISPRRGNCLRSATDTLHFCHVDGLVGEGVQMDTIGDAFERW